MKLILVLALVAGCLYSAVGQGADLAPASFDPQILSPATGTSAVPANAPAPVLAIPEAGEIGSTAPGPGLKGIFGNNVTILIPGDNSNCSARGPDTRLSGSGTFIGTGLFVGEGTFNSTGTEPGQFILANATFIGNANCTGIGTFYSTSVRSTLGGDGTATGRGLFRLPQGLFNGSGSFSGVNLTFEGGVGSLYGNQGYLHGQGNATGEAIRCTGSGAHFGSGSFQGTGQFIGQGYYYATLPTDSATFVGTGLLEGNGECGPGGSAITTYTDAVNPTYGLDEVINQGNEAYEAVQEVGRLLA